MAHLPRLPPELWDRIRSHAAASLIQSRFLRWVRFGHARRPGWDMTRLHIPPLVWRLLIPYAQVRREWRLEAASWECCDIYDWALILQEAHGGAWGPRWTIDCGTAADRARKAAEAAEA